VWLFVMSLMLLRASAKDEAPRRTGGGNFVRDIGQVVAVPWARIVVSTVFIEGLVLFGALAFVPTHLHDARGFALSTAGLAMLLFAGGGVIFALLARRLIGRLGEVGLAVAGTVLVALGLALIAWTPLAFVAPLGCLSAGLGFYMLHNTLQANATQMAPERRGAGMAIFASVYFVGQAIGVAIAGHAAERVGAGSVVAIAAILILPIGLVFARLRRARDSSLRE